MTLSVLIISLSPTMLSISTTSTSPAAASAALLASTTSSILTTPSASTTLSVYAILSVSVLIISVPILSVLIISVPTLSSVSILLVSTVSTTSSVWAAPTSSILTFITSSTVNAVVVSDADAPNISVNRSLTSSPVISASAVFITADSGAGFAVLAASASALATASASASSSSITNGSFGTDGSEAPKSVSMRSSISSGVGVMAMSTPFSSKTMDDGSFPAVSSPAGGSAKSTGAASLSSTISADSSGISCGTPAS